MFTDSAITTNDDYEVVVIGCGMAGLTAGVRAAELGRDVAILEIAPEERRGGQTQFTDLIRVPSTETDIEAYGYEFDAEYSSSDFYRDIMRVTRGRADADLAKTLVDNAGPTVAWMTEHGVEWEDAGVPAEHWQGTVVQHQNVGATTVGMLVDIAEELGADVHYETKAKELVRDGELHVSGVLAVAADGPVRFDCDAVVVASGGFESNVEKRSRYLGKDYDTIVVRGSRYNTGEPTEAAIDVDAKATGHWSGAHVTIIDAGSPPVEGGENKVYGYPYAVVVNHDGERIFDEGADMQTFTYAAYGHEVFAQPEQEAFVLCDSRLSDHVYSTGPTDAIRGDTIEELARRLGVGDPEATAETVAAFNDACDPGEFVPNELDGNRTEGVEPAKTNWAIPLSEPPFYGYPITAGITFTFGGLAINPAAEVLDTSDEVIPGLYAAGSCTGGLFYFNYPSGSALAQAAVYGRIAGENASEHVAGG